MVRTSLWPGEAPMAQGREPADIPSVAAYLVEATEPAPAVLVCPGGGYRHLADHEGEPIARFLNQLGISAFVLSYRLAPYRFPAPLLDGARAIRWIRHHAGPLNVDPERVGVIGFSAGGHLAAMLAHPPEGWTRGGTDSDAVDAESARPSVVILAYPVTIMDGAEAHGTAGNLLGPDPDQDLRRQCSLPVSPPRSTTPRPRSWPVGSRHVSPSRAR